VLSTHRLDAVTAVDAVAGQLTAGAGVTIEGVHAAAAAAGWAYGVDFGARASATVGGSVATNAGGINVLRHGDTRAQVVGLEAVLADGSIVSHLGGLLKDNTGYHLPSLLCGSEGTLAVVTAARLRLVPHLPERVTALVALDSVQQALDVVAALRRRVASLEAAELMLADGMALVGAALGAEPPLRSPVALLVECTALDDPSPHLAAACDALGLADVRVAVDATRRSELWRWRERHTESIAALGVVHKLDVTLPAPHLAGFVDEVRAEVAALDAGAHVWIFGHVADGNLHVNVTGAGGDAGEHVDELVLSLVARLGGSISAEHGIGRLKARWLHLSRTPAELAAMRAIRRALDPAGILNPGVLLD
jgi:FAD/FMN-containing dehydrogenase